MVIKVYGVNVWASPRGEVQLAPLVPVFLAQRLKDMERPTPFSAMTIEGYGIHSRLSGNKILEDRILNGKVILVKGDYIMMLPKADIAEYADAACGHLHYYDGEKLISVYTNEVYETDEMYTIRVEADKLIALKNSKWGKVPTKKWIEGHLTGAGFIVTYEEAGIERKMQFPTEGEAQEYFKEE